MYPPFCIGIVLLIAALCLQVAEHDEAKKQIVSLLGASYRSTFEVVI